MKKTAVAACLLVLALSAARAQSPTELIAQVGDSLLIDYARPLIESYSVAMGSGLFHSAKAHKFLGFDLGVRLMAIRIPTAGKTFTARVLACSANTKLGRVDSFYVDVQNAATIFGKRGLDTSWIPDGAVGIPPGLPGGLGIDYMPFILPQASVGLPIPGMELMVRYVPWPFQGTTVNFLGLGLKEELTTISGFNLPFNLAVQGFYQKMQVGTAINSSTIGLNAHASKGLTLITPYVGLGMSSTKMGFDYEFKYRRPTGVDRETHQLTFVDASDSVKYDYNSGAQWRATLGVSLNVLPLVILNADYSRNLSSGYYAFTGGLSLALR
jgi:hypothetical protein